MLTWRPLIVATAVPSTRPLMKGALGFWKICWMGPENWLAGCVQLWFSMAVTKTVLIERSSARAFHWIERVSRTNKPSVPKRLTCDINYLQKSGFGADAGQLNMEWTNTPAGTGILSEDENQMTFW